MAPTNIWYSTNNQTIPRDDKGIFLNEELQELSELQSNSDCIANLHIWLIAIGFTLLVFLIATLHYFRHKHGSSEAKRQKKLKKEKKRQIEEEKAIASIPVHPIEAQDFLEFLELRRKHKVFFKAEFQMIQKVDKFSTEYAERPENALKNNWKVLPYDHTRVVLTPIIGIPCSDYVNATYIDSLHEPRKYIAAQGPNKKQVPDFWRLVWQENCSVVVMLTRVFDFTKVVSCDYWIQDENEDWGGLKMEVLSKETFANMCTRTLKLKKDVKERKIKHFQYLEWPMHQVTDNAALLEFRRWINAHVATTEGDGPILIHCCDGAGRTGVYIAIDANLELLEKEGLIDVFGYVKKLRETRPKMVDTLEQYRFIYDCVEEFLVCGTTVCPVLELAAKMKRMSTKNAITKRNEYQREFQVLNKRTLKLSIGDCAGGHRVENRYKNRDVIMVPPDYARPYLSSFQGNDRTDYINAVYVDGYIRKNDFIVTEWPMRNTICDFWSLIYDHNCKAVVILSNPRNPLAHPQMFPESGKKMYGVFGVDVVSSQSYPNINTFIYKVKKKTLALSEVLQGVTNETKTVQFWHLTCWPSGHKVPTSTTALVELMDMVDRWRQRTDYGPIIIVSTNGVSRSGVFCAARIAIEQVLLNQEVDVFQAVRTVKINRPVLIENAVEYKYCYDVVLHYIYMVAQGKNAS